VVEGIRHDDRGDEPTQDRGRKLLGWLLSLYGLAVFEYLTATLASHFIGRERQSPSTDWKEGREP